MNKVAILERIVNDRQATKIVVNDGGKNRKIIVDVLSANTALKVINLVNEANRAKLLAMPIHKMIGTCLSVYAKVAA